MVTGRVVRFDEFRGYGFVAPDTGGEDVFVHVNDLDFDKTLLAPGIRLSFEIEEGDRGLKASHVQLAEPERRPSASAPRPTRSETAPWQAAPRELAEPSTDEEEAALPSVAPDVVPGTEPGTMSRKQYLDEVTEILLESAPAATAEQIVSIRQRLLRSALRHGWVTD